MPEAESRRHDDPWWLGGTESCESCGQAYAYEMELRCGHCDGALCPLCAVRVRELRLVLCVGCHEPGAPAGGGG